MTPTPPGTERSLLSGGAYAVANSLQRALAFVLLPLYTAVLSPAEYGRLGVLLTVQGGVSVLFAAGMESAVTREYFRLAESSSAQTRFVMSIWKFVFLSTSAVAALACLILLAFVPDTETFKVTEGALTILTSLTFVLATVIPFTVLRASQRLKDYLNLTLVAGISTTILAVLLVVVLRVGVVGWIVASLIANLLTFVVATRIMPWIRNLPLDTTGIRHALAIGLPLLPHAVSLWALQLADRIILATLVSVSALGVYTLAANLALPALVVLVSVNQGFLPSYARQSSAVTADDSLRGVIAMQAILAMLVGCGIALLGPPIVSVLSDTYHGAGPLVGWIVLGYVFLGFYFIPMNVISLIAGRPTFVAIVTLTAAGVNIGAIFWLVPELGLTGAAVASALGYLVLFVLTCVYAITIGATFPVPWRTIAFNGAAIGAAYAAGALLLPDDGLLGFVSRGALLAIVATALAYRAGMLRVIADRVAGRRAGDRSQAR